MSFDFATEKVCNHRILFESQILDPDTGTFITFDKTPASSVVAVQIDGVDIPQSGLYSSAEVVFSNQEPYRITSGVNDVVLLKIGSDPPFLVQLLTGKNIKASDLATDLNRKIPNLIFTPKNGRVVVGTKGPFKGSAFSFPDPRWTDKTSSLLSTPKILNALKELGVSPGKVAFGRKLFPGWIVKINENTFVPEYVLVFDEPIFNNSPIVTVSYQTIAQQCRRCQGSRIEYDYSVLNGTYEAVKNTDLLAQEFDKFIFTIKGSHWKWRWLGSPILDRIGGKASTAFGTASGFVTLDITQAFAIYQNIKQNQDRNFPQQKVSDAEYPYSLDGVAAQVDKNDPTTVAVITTVQSRSSVSVPLTRTISLPDPFQLTNGNPGSFIQRG